MPEALQWIIVTGFFVAFTLGYVMFLLWTRFRGRR
jgi:uncharacterized membrane protein